MHELGADFAGTAVMSPSRSLFSLQGPHFAIPGTTPLSCFKLGADFARTDVASLTIFSLDNDSLIICNSSRKKFQHADQVFENE